MVKYYDKKVEIFSPSFSIKEPQNRERTFLPELDIEFPHLQSFLHFSHTDVKYKDVTVCMIFTFSIFRNIIKTHYLLSEMKVDVTLKYFNSHQL